MGRSRFRLVGALAFGVALLATACGGSGGDGNATTNATVDPGIKSAVAAVLGGGSTGSTVNGGQSTTSTTAP